MTKRKPKQTFFRDERGRFAHASPKVRAGLEAMRIHRAEDAALDVLRPVPPPNRIVRSDGRHYYEDAIYRPERKGWIERALTWFTWNRSRA